LRAFDAKSRLGVSPLILQTARDFQRRKFVHNTFRAVGSFYFFHVSLSRSEFTWSAVLGAGELFGEVGRHSGNLCGTSAIGKAISGAAWGNSARGGRARL
jgi:hypothetical protein